MRYHVTINGLVWTLHGRDLDAAMTEAGRHPAGSTVTFPQGLTERVRSVTVFGTRGLVVDRIPVVVPTEHCTCSAVTR